MGRECGIHEEYGICLKRLVGELNGESLLEDLNIDGKVMLQ
jgi:hypothetical protein